MDRHRGAPVTMFQSDAWISTSLLGIAELRKNTRYEQLER
jgi:hypothetical protein